MSRFEVEGAMSYQEEGALPPPISRLQMVHEALHLRPDVFIAGGGPVVKRNLEDYWSEWNHFIVAPRESMFDIDQLEAFRQTLLLPPDVRPGNSDAARNVWYGKNDFRNHMDVGWVAYDDFLGIRKKGFTDTVEEQESGVAARLGLSVEPPKIVEQRLNRRTIISLYPHPLLATVVHDVISNPSAFDKRLNTL